MLLQEALLSASCGEELERPGALERLRGLLRRRHGGWERPARLKPGMDEEPIITAEEERLRPEPPEELSPVWGAEELVEGVVFSARSTDRASEEMEIVVPENNPRSALFRERVDAPETADRVGPSVHQISREEELIIAPGAELIEEPLKGLEAAL